MQPFASCNEWGFPYSGFSCCRAQALGANLVVVVHRLNCPEACGPGIEPVSAELAGRFLSTVPPGKSHPFISNIYVFMFKVVYCRQDIVGSCF